MSGILMASSMAGSVGGGGFTYTTWNPDDKGFGISLSGGNLTATSGALLRLVRTTQVKSSGKWYWEVLINSLSAECRVGITVSSVSSSSQLGVLPESWGWSSNGGLYTKGAQTAGGLGGYTTGDTLAFHLDMDEGNFYASKNSSTLDLLLTGLTGKTIYPATSPYVTSITANFGESAFTYGPKAGYNAGVYV